MFEAMLMEILTFAVFATIYEIFAVEMFKTST